MPKPVVYPILVFIGLEFTAQSFLATPRRHYAAVALACLPALAFLAMSLPGRIFGDGAAFASEFNIQTLQSEGLKRDLLTLSMLSNGFIVTSLLWAWCLAALIDRKLRVATTVLVAAGVLTMFGIIHSPLSGNRLFLPFGPESIGLNAWGEGISLDPANRRLVLEFAAGYFASAALIFAWSYYPPANVADDHAIDT